MIILALDTAAPVVSVAVHDGERVLGAATGSEAMAHGERDDRGGGVEREDNHTNGR